MWFQSQNNFRIPCAKEKWLDYICIPWKRYKGISNIKKNYKSLTLFQTGSGITLSDEGGPLWPSLIFCYITQQKVALTPETCSQIKFLIFRHPFTPLFQHSRESVPLFMSVNVDQYLHIETLKIGKTPKGPPFENEKNFCLRFWWNSKHAILMT